MCCLYNIKYIGLFCNTLYLEMSAGVVSGK